MRSSYVPILINLNVRTANEMFIIDVFGFSFRRAAFQPESLES